jgi:hypothetical protein
MTEKVMAPPGSNHGKAYLPQRSHQIGAGHPRPFDSCCDRDALNADELQTLFGRTLHFEAQRERFPNPLRNLVEGSRLCMARRDLRDRGDIEAILITFDDDVELVLQCSTSPIF